MKPLTRTTTKNGAPLLNLELPSRCDICSKPRNKGKHYACSRQRQMENAHRHAGRAGR